MSEADEVRHPPQMPSLAIRIQPELYAKISAMAEADNRSVSYVVRKLVAYAIDRLEAHPREAEKLTGIRLP